MHVRALLSTLKDHLEAYVEPLAVDESCVAWRSNNGRNMTVINKAEKRKKSENKSNL